MAVSQDAVVQQIQSKINKIKMTEKYNKNNLGYSGGFSRLPEFSEDCFPTRPGEAILPTKFAIQEGFSRLSLNLSPQGSSLEGKTKTQTD